MDERFAAIRAEAASRGSDLEDPAAFMLLAQVGASLQDLRPDHGETSPELFHTFGSFLFHAFHLLRGEASGLLLDVEPAAARYLVEANPSLEGWDTTPPARAGYLRLPPHLFWTRPSGEAAPAEAVDGISWCTGGREKRIAGDPQSHPERQGSTSGLSLLVITGVRADRPGFSVLPLPVVPLADVGAWLMRKARPDGAGEDFQSTLPGGELGNLYSIETTGEVLKLVVRALGYAMTVPGAMSAPATPPRVPINPGGGGSDLRGADPDVDKGLASAMLRLVGAG